MQVYNQPSSNANFSGFTRPPNLKKALSMPVMTPEQTDVYFGSGRVTRSSNKGLFSSILGGGGKPPRKPGGKKPPGHETAEQTTGAGSRVVRARRSQLPVSVGEEGSDSSALSSVGSQTPSLPGGTIPQLALNPKSGKHYRRKLIRDDNPGIGADELEKLYGMAGVPTETSAPASKSAQQLLKDYAGSLNPERRMKIRNRIQEEGEKDGWTEEQIQQRIDDAGVGLQKKPIPGGGATARWKRRIRIQEEGEADGRTEDQINEAISEAGAVKRPRGGHQLPLKPVEELNDKARHNRRKRLKEKGRKAGWTEAQINQEIENAGLGKIRGVKPAEELSYKGQHSRRKRLKEKGRKAGWTEAQINQEIENAGLGTIHQVRQEEPSAHAGSGNEGMGNWIETTPGYQALQQLENQGYGAENLSAPPSSSSGAVFNMPALAAGLGSTESLIRHRSPSLRTSVAPSDHTSVGEGEAALSPMRSVHSASPPVDPALEAYTAQNAQSVALPPISEWYNSPPPPEPAQRATYEPTSVRPHNYPYSTPARRQQDLYDLAEAAARMPIAESGITQPPGYPMASPFSAHPPTLRSPIPPRVANYNPSQNRPQRYEPISGFSSDIPAGYVLGPAGNYYHPNDPVVSSSGTSTSRYRGHRESGARQSQPNYQTTPASYLGSVDQRSGSPTPPGIVKRTTGYYDKWGSGPFPYGYKFIGDELPEKYK